ncbi:MAG: fumarylacetoacetate hydrolase family protein [Rhodobacterales bacterium]|nr:fumarylacetoacetate hydrolase family protein [Rhodobacterales bacterium]
MKFLSFEQGDRPGLAVETAQGFRGLRQGDAGYPGQLPQLIRTGGLAAAGAVLAEGQPVDPAKVRHLPPVAEAGKFLCVGLNYRAHTAEGPYEQPDYPTLFARFSSSLIGHGDALVRPRQSEKFDYEGELVAVIGKTARDVPVERALDHVAGYSIFNDGSLRDYQRRTPQWTPGKNFDGTGAFGPVFVTADALPPGCIGLRLQTRLNGQVVQDTLIDDMVFPVATLIAIISEVMTLNPGDVIVTGTPSGVGHARKPPLWMKPGDICEVEIDRIGVLSNSVRDA